MPILNICRNTDADADCDVREQFVDEKQQKNII